MEDVTVRFGGVTALSNVTLAIGEGEIGGLIGPNGAGKTTAFNVITRIYSPDAGKISFDGENLLRVPPHGIVRRRGERKARAAALEILDYLGLAGVAERPAAGLPFGTLKRVELARALVSRPRLLLLDEPAGGLNHEEIGTLAELIRNLRREFELTILLVEHHMNLVMVVSDRVNVLNFGRKLAEGTPAEVRTNPDVIESYLGRDIDAPA